MIPSKKRRSWRHWQALSAVTLAVLALAIVCIELADGRVRLAAKERLIAMDARYIGGTLRKLYSLKLTQNIPATVALPGVDAYSWIGSERFFPIAHALGPTMSAGRNSIPTFEEGLRRGFRVFEVDLALTSDGRLVCYHGDDTTDEIAALSFSAYRDSIAGRGISTCAFADLALQARQHPNVRFILDVKTEFERTYRYVRQAAAAAGVGKSFIPQIYEFSQLEALRREPMFAGEIFTSYRSVLTNAEIFAAARRLHVEAVTLTLDRFRQLDGHAPRDLSVFVHPVEDPYQAAYFREQGARGVYTSYLTPTNVPELFGSLRSPCCPRREPQNPPPVAGSKFPTS